MRDRVSQEKNTGRELKSFDSSRSAVRASAASICVLLIAGVAAGARTHRSQSWADTQFAKAESLRQTLNGHSEQARTRHEYQAVIASYSRIVREAPTSTKADGSTFAAAELTAEMGRHFKDDNALYSALRQYKFLRREYPGSKHRIEALLAIGEIYKNDLGDDLDARGAFEELIRRYPHSKLAEEARAELGLAVQTASAIDEKPIQKTQDKSGDDSATERLSAKEPSTEKTIRVTAVQHWSTPDYTRITVDLEQDVQFESQRIGHPDRIFFDLKNTRLSSDLVGKSLDVDDGLVKKVRIAQFKPGRARIVIETAAHAKYNASLLLNPARLIIDVHNDDVHGETVRTRHSPTETALPNSADNTAATEVTTVDSGTASAAAVPKKIVVEVDDDDTAENNVPPSPRVSAKPAKATTLGRTRTRVGSSRAISESQPTSSGDRSLIRALGLKIGKIVIDPGHGGHDTGTIGPNGLLEKDLVLDVSKRLGKLLEARLGADVAFTRRDDTFIPLETRTSIANQAQADLFVSVHANSSRDPDARGVETYYLNFTSSPEALEVAARENAASDKSIHELQDLVKKIALKEKIEESREFASDIQQSLHSGLAAKAPGMRDRGVKKAPFVVLIGANMPSILAEISFISNPGDERRLKNSDYRQRIAESLFRGISRYVNGLGGVKVASKIEKASVE